MSVLVTGGAGFLGSKVVAALRDVGQTVQAPTRVELDLTNPIAVETFLTVNSVERIVHLAACLDRREDLEAQERQWQDTFTAGRSVVAAAARAGVAQVIVTGSMDEVGTVEGLIPIDAPIRPLTTYGLCKAALLEMCRFTAARSSLSVEWVRPTAIYGPGQDGPMLVPSAFRAAVGGAGQFTDGKQYRDFIYADDVVGWLVAATQLTLAEKAGAVTVHHLGSGEPVQVREMLEKIGELSGASFVLGAIPRRAGEPDLVGVHPFVDSRAPLADWRPTTPLADGLKLTWDWWATRS